MHLSPTLQLHKVTMGARHLALLCLCCYSACCISRVYSYSNIDEDIAGLQPLSGRQSNSAVQAAARGNVHRSQGSNKLGEYEAHMQVAQNSRILLGMDTAAQRSTPKSEDLSSYRNIDVQQNGTALITSANKTLNPSLPWGATAFSYRSDLRCGTQDAPSPPVGFCILTGRITQATPNDPTAAEAIMEGQCDLNSNAGPYCDKKLKNGATILVRGLGAVKFQSNEQLPIDTAIEAIFTNRLFVRNMQYNEGPDTVVGAINSLRSSYLGFKHGIMTLNVMRGRERNAPSPTLLGTIVFNLS